ncbi:MAG TPA: isoamylase early set domain-containing protein [Acidimicrobiales bacterium]|nr:isoamylase early set domain-containing protein [Acidimicrobiales bacterium]
MRITFQLPVEYMLGTVSVVGDFNGWEPGVTVFQGRGSMRTATVDVEPGRRYGFRYFSEGGGWFDDDDADEYEPSELGTRNGVIDLTSMPRHVNGALKAG